MSQSAILLGIRQSVQWFWAGLLEVWSTRRAFQNVCYWSMMWQELSSSLTRWLHICWIKLTFSLVLLLKILFLHCHDVPPHRLPQPLPNRADWKFYKIVLLPQLLWEAHLECQLQGGDFPGWLLDLLPTNWVAWSTSLHHIFSGDKTACSGRFL